MIHINCDKATLPTQVGDDSREGCMIMSKAAAAADQELLAGLQHQQQHQQQDQQDQQGCVTSNGCSPPKNSVHNHNGPLKTNAEGNDGLLAAEHVLHLSGADNKRISKYQALICPQLLIEEIPVTPKSSQTVVSSRKKISNVIQGKDDRLIVIVGPCSVHDPAAALEYATMLQVLCCRFVKDLLVVMRTYFEKPRTTVGWKGLLNDPDLNNSFEVNKGLRIGRRLLSDITNLGVPVGCEYLDTTVPQYTADLVSWAAIGARTTECQLHRELASGLSMPVGFKNGTTGDVKIAVDACLSARHPHAFIGITKQGVPAVFHSTGNEDSHVILRGGNSETNYNEKCVLETVGCLSKVSCCPKVIIDFSHGNSQKDHRKQMLACEDVCSQLSRGSPHISGVMIESNLNEGNQPLPSSSIPTSTSTSDGLQQAAVSQNSSKGFSMVQDQAVLSQLRYGVSVTDACVSWETTLLMVENLAKAVQERRRCMKHKYDCE